MDPVWIVLFAFGSSIGSFLNVLIDRLPLGLDVVHGRSHCDHCQRTLAWYELFPVFSWIIQGGTSRCCHKKLSVQYPLIELSIGIGFVLLYQYYGGVFSVPFFSALLLLVAFVGICVTDLKTECIPEVFLYMGGIAAAGILSPVLVACTHGAGIACTVLLYRYIIPTAVGIAFFFLLWLFSKGRAMGDGDIYLAGIIGMVLGYPFVIIAYYAAFLTGAIAGVILILVHRKRMKSHIPFGPFMIAGFGVAVLYGPAILHWWSQLW